MNCKTEVGTDKSGEGEAVFLTVQQVADLTQCSPRHIYRMEKRGQIPQAVRLGANVRWSKRAIDDWIAAGCPTTPDRNDTTIT